MVWWHWFLIILGFLIISLPISMWYIKVAPRKPTNEGDWVSDNAKTASVTVEGRVLTIKNVSKVSTVSTNLKKYFYIIYISKKRGHTPHSNRFYYT